MFSLLKTIYFFTIFYYNYICSLIRDLLAQLGERNLDRVEVGGSNPSQVITNPNIMLILGFFLFQGQSPIGADPFYVSSPN